MNQTTAENLMKITQESYQKIASSFSETRNFSWVEIDLAIEKYLKNNCKILDLGCGNGRLLLSLKKYLENFDYTGVDSCLELIKKAQLSFASSQLSPLSFPRKRESRNIAFERGDILNLTNFADNSFDCVFMIASFNHVASVELREKLLLDVKRVLKPNGFLIMTNWNLWNVYNKKSVWSYILSSRVESQRSLGGTEESHIFSGFPIRSGMTIKDVLTFWQNQSPIYYHAFTLRELKKLLPKTNFKILANYYVKDGQKSFWFNGKNILTIGQKII